MRRAKIIHYLRCRVDAGATAKELLEIVEKPWQWLPEIEAAWKDFRPKPHPFVVITNKAIEA